MHLVSMSFGSVPPFTEPVTFKFDERVNLFVGPNASGKSTVLQMLADCLIGPDENSKRPISRGVTLISDDRFDKLVQEALPHYGPPNFLSASKVGDPPVVHIGSVREELPGISNQERADAFGKTAAEALNGPFSGSRTMRASKLLGEELWSEQRFYEEEIEDPDARDDFELPELINLMNALELADACSKRICDEVIRDSTPDNYIYGLNVRALLNSPFGDPSDIPILRRMGINTTDIRNFNYLPYDEQPSYSAYTKDVDSVPIYLGHLSSGTEGTLLWIRWLALKMVHHYKFEDGWEKKPAILLIDEIENHLHPTWQRRVIPALLNDFPGLQIFASTHSPFMVAGLKAGQVHLLKRDAGTVTATTYERDVVGWTMDEILRTIMDVDEPTDQLTVDRANRLRQLREKETLTPEEESELNALRRQVNMDLMSKSGPLEAQRERYAELMERFLLSRQSDLTQDGE